MRAIAAKQRCAGSKLRDHTFSSHDVPHRRTRAHSFAKGQQARIWGQIEICWACPIGNDEEIHIADRKVVAEQIGIARQMLFHVSEPAIEALAKDCLDGWG